MTGALDASVAADFDAALAANQGKPQEVDLKVEMVRLASTQLRDDAIRHAVRLAGRLASGLDPGPNSDRLTQVLERLDLPLTARAV